MLKKIRGKVENNPIFKFRQFWCSLTQHEQANLWDILTALRGDDNNSRGFDVKLTTTARIRFELLGTKKSKIAREVCCIQDKDDYHPNESIAHEFKNSNGHFKDHVALAVLSLAKYVHKKRINDLYKVIGLDRK